MEPGECGGGTSSQCPWDKPVPTGTVGAAAEAAGKSVSSAVLGSRERNIKNRDPPPPMPEGFPVRRMSPRLEKKTGTH